MVEIFQTLSVLNSILLWNAVIIPGACASKGLDVYFPRFYAKTFQIGKKISNIAFPVASLIILTGGLLTLSQELYALWILVIMCVFFLCLGARHQKVEIEELKKCI